MKRRVSESPDPIDKHVGARIRGRRVGLRLSQTKLGQAIGVTFQQVQKYENGANRIGASNLYKVAKALDVDVRFFYEGVDGAPDHGGEATGPGSGEYSARPFVPDPMTSREAIELMHNYYRIPNPEIRRRLFQFIRTLGGSTEPAVAAVAESLPASE